MTYFATSTVYIFFITTFSLFLSKQFRVKNELSLIYSILIISIITFCLFQLNLLRYGFFVIFICSVFIFIKIKINKFNDHTLRFVLYSSLLVLFCYGKYFLDEDELTFWGINSKFIYYNFFSPTIIDAKTHFSIQYHSKLLTTFQSLGFIFSNFREDILILINNLIILATFFALFKSNKNNWGIQFFYFGIFYFLLNLFSFGLNSIYADIIVVLLTSLLFKKLYSNELDLFSLLLIIAIPLVHRIGNLFIFIFFLNLIIINQNFIKKNLFKVFLVLLITVPFFYTKIIFFLNKYLSMRFYLDNFKSFIIEKNPIEIIQIFIQYIKDISFYNTPYIKFLKLFEDAFKFLKLDYNVISFDIKVYQVLIILVIVNFFFFKNRKLFFLNLSNLIIFMFVIFFVKNYQENLHPYATVRYIMLFALFYFVLVLSLKFDQPNNKKNILMVIILLSLVLPSKSIGFFLPHKIYLNDKINFEYYSFVNNLKKIKKEFKFEKNINNFIYVSNNSLSSIERSRLYFEFYPDIYRSNNQNIFTIDEYIELKNVIKKMKNANKRIKENDIIREKNIHINIVLTQADLEGFDENTIVKKLKVKN